MLAVLLGFPSRVVVSLIRPPRVIVRVARVIVTRMYRAAGKVYQPAQGSSDNNGLNSIVYASHGSQVSNRLANLAAGCAVIWSARVRL